MWTRWVRLAVGTDAADRTAIARVSVVSFRVPLSHMSLGVSVAAVSLKAIRLVAVIDIATEHGHPLSHSARLVRT
jgi:hypothetical protein